MKRFTAISCAVLAAVAFVGSQALAQVATNPPVVYYSFNTPATLLTADTGASLSTFTFNNFNGGVIQSFAGTTLNAQPLFLAGNTASMNKMNSDGTDSGYFQFTLDATGLQEIKITYAAARSSSSSNGPADRWVLQYSTDLGANWNVFATNSMGGVANNTWVAWTNDLSAVTALNNNSQDEFRLVIGGSSVNTGGTARLDNLTLYGVIPEPSTIFLVGLGLAGLFAVRRRS